MAGLVKVFVDEVSWHCEAEDCDQNSEEGKANFTWIEAVNLAEDDWECFKPDVGNAIDKRCVYSVC